jgi:hypothetical protein
MRSAPLFEGVERSPQPYAAAGFAVRPLEKRFSTLSPWLLVLVERLPDRPNSDQNLT